jgi:hypothetical protein
MSAISGKFRSRIRRRLEARGLSGPSILMGFEGEQDVATANGSLNLLHTSYERPALVQSIEERLVTACS